MRLRGCCSSRACRRRLNAAGSLLPLRPRYSLSLALCLLLLTLVVTSQLSGWGAGTASGDNLVPTPWHTFPADNPRTGWEKMRRGAQLLWCSTLCPHWTSAASASATGLPTGAPPPPPSDSACPAYFQWIYDDLAPWRQRGVSRANVLAAKRFAAFRVVILQGRLYVEYYYRCVQGRAIFTVWSLLLLLERFPGQVPDAEFMFDCMDRPQIRKAGDQHQHQHQGSAPPPLFRYCSSEEHFDIPFPDWSFWGWPETRVRPWPVERDSILQGAAASPWKARDKFAYWRGNPHVAAPVREELLLCNSSSYKTHIYSQDWGREYATGYKSSSLADHCHHRYMIYSEGHAWSVSYKYILACGSPVLAIRSSYYEFFTRGLLPSKHYLPVERDKLCDNLKRLVERGNRAPKEMMAMAATSRDFLLHDLSMDNVYNYMLQLLTEYSRLLTYKPSVPRLAEPVCRAKLLCTATPAQREFLEQSNPSPVSQPLDQSRSCAMPAFNASYFREILSARELGS